MKIKGLHTYRLKDNAEEAKFAQAWDEQITQGNTLAYLLHTGDQSGMNPPSEPSDRDHQVAATVIQWLGSPVGQSFLEELGYVKKQAEKPKPLLKRLFNPNNN